MDNIIDNKRELSYLCVRRRRPTLFLTIMCFRVRCALLRFRFVRFPPPLKKEKILLVLIGYGIISVLNLKNVPPCDTLPNSPGHKFPLHALPIESSGDELEPLHVI